MRWRLNFQFQMERNADLAARFAPASPDCGMCKPDPNGAKLREWENGSNPIPENTLMTVPASAQGRAGGAVFDPILAGSKPDPHGEGTPSGFLLLLGRSPPRVGRKAANPGLLKTSPSGKRVNLHLNLLTKRHSSLTPSFRSR